MKNRYMVFIFFFISSALYTIDDQQNIQSSMIQPRRIIVKIYNKPVVDAVNESSTVQETKHTSSPEISLPNVGSELIKPVEKNKGLDELTMIAVISTYVYHPPTIIIQYITGVVIYKIFTNTTSLLQNQYSYFTSNKKDKE